MLINKVVGTKKNSVNQKGTTQQIGNFLSARPLHRADQKWAGFSGILGSR